MNPLKVGVVGAGWIGLVHAEGWAANVPRAEIVAVCDVSEPRARDLGERFGGGQAKVYTDLGALLADSAVEAVDVCLPHHLHTDAILRSARAGKAILCEKPLCTSLEDAARIRAAVREAGVTFMPAHNQLFVPSVGEARRILADGTLGKVYLVRSIEVGRNRGLQTGQPPVDLAPGESPFAWRLDLERMGGGEVLDTGWHGTYRLLALANDRPVEVAAMMGRYFFEQLPSEDTGSLLIRFASGAIGEVLTSWAFGLPGGWQFEIGAENGSIAGSPTRTVHQLNGWPEPAVKTNPPISSYTAEITHFLDVVQRGVPQIPTLDHSLRVLQVIKGAYQSVAEKRVIALPEEPTVL
jgi:predicted dehydrogenase